MKRTALYFVTRVQVIAIALLFTGCVTTYEITSISMEPTLKEGQSITTLPVEEGQLQRGDIIIHRDLRYEDELHTKRIIALPGETIEISDGQIFVDGELLIEEYAVVH